MEQLPAFRGIQFGLHRQAGALEQIFDPLNLGFRQTKQRPRQFCRRDLADGNRLAMQKCSVAGNVLDGVADGVAKIQNRAQAALGFILADDLRLDFAAARDYRGENGLVAVQNFRQVAFEPLEQISRRK